MTSEAAGGKKLQSKSLFAASRAVFLTRLERQRQQTLHPSSSHPPLSPVFADDNNEQSKSFSRISSGSHQEANDDNDNDNDDSHCERMSSNDKEKGQQDEPELVVQENVMAAPPSSSSPQNNEPYHQLNVAPSASSSDDSSDVTGPVPASPEQEAVAAAAANFTMTSTLTSRSSLDAHHDDEQVAQVPHQQQQSPLSSSSEVPQSPMMSSGSEEESMSSSEEDDDDDDDDDTDHDDDDDDDEEEDESLFTEQTTTWDDSRRTNLSPNNNHWSSTFASSTTSSAEEQQGSTTFSSSLGTETFDTTSSYASGDPLLPVNHHDSTRTSSPRRRRQQDHAASVEDFVRGGAGGLLAALDDTLQAVMAVQQEHPEDHTCTEDDAGGTLTTSDNRLTMSSSTFEDRGTMTTLEDDDERTEEDDEPTATTTTTTTMDDEDDPTLTTLEGGETMVSTFEDGEVADDERTIEKIDKKQATAGTTEVELQTEENDVEQEAKEKNNEVEGPEVEAKEQEQRVKAEEQTDNVEEKANNDAQKRKDEPGKQSGDDEEKVRNDGDEETKEETKEPQAVAESDNNSDANESTIDSPSGPTSSSGPSTLTPNLSLRNPASPRQRVPGGAAAKLMLMGPRKSEETEESDIRPASSHDTITSRIVQEGLREIELVMERTKQEFEKGSESNRRYEKGSEKDDSCGEEGEKPAAASAAVSQAPSFLNRDEIFHKTASAAISALLTPRMQGDGASRVSNVNTVMTTASGDLQPAFSGQMSTCSAFQAPDPSSPPGGRDASYESFGRRDVSGTLLTPITERKLENINKKMHDPTKTLADLLTAIASPEDDSQMDLGFMVRRKNACGAVKVLSNDPKKRVMICWTVGVLPALTSVLADQTDEGLQATFPDKRIRTEYEAARNRAIAALINLSIPKENRIPIFHTPDLVQSLLLTIMQDKGEARRGCTAVLAYLSKSVENRLLLAQVPGLSDAVTSVLCPRPPRVEPRAFPDRVAKKTYPWSSGSDSSDSETDDEREKSFVSSPSVASQSHDDDTEKTLKMVPSKTPVELSGYDETADEQLRGARQNMFALLGHLVKQKDNAYYFARDSSLVQTMVKISYFQESPSHTFAVKMLANLTRHRLNTKIMVFQEHRVTPALVKAAESERDETRLYACYALQNLAQDKSCRQELAVVDGLVSTLCNRSRFANSEDERLAAISALKNLCDEPANLIPLTNTPECIATLMHLAHGKEEGVNETMQYRACDALATLSHWLRKIATSGKSLGQAQQGQTPDTGLFVPSLRVITWNQWQ